MAVALGLSGIGAGLCFLPLTIAVLGGTTESEGPKAASFINLALQLGGSVSVAVLDVLLHGREELYSTVLGGNATLASPTIRDFIASHSIEALAQQIYLQADILAYAYVTFAIGAVTALCIPLVLLLRRGKPPAVPIEIGNRRIAKV